MAKYRGNSKIKHEHGMIEGLERYLRSIEDWPEIKSILTGVITRRKGTSPFVFQVQYETETGLKCLAKYQGAVQEVFITTNDPKALAARLRTLKFNENS